MFWNRSGWSGDLKGLTGLVVAMFRNYRNCRRGVVSLALAFTLIQCYVLYSSTFHVLHHSKPMCPACVAIKKYQGAVVNAVQTVVAVMGDITIEDQVLPQIALVQELKYHSRAPPVL